MDWQQEIRALNNDIRDQHHSTIDEILDRKIAAASDGLLPAVASLFSELSDMNKRFVAEFILDLVNRKNIAANTKSVHLRNLVYLVRFWRGMNLREMKKDHVDGYLQILRRNREVDPDQKWIATHNNRAMTYS